MFRLLGVYCLLMVCLAGAQASAAEEWPEHPRVWISHDGKFTTWAKLMSIKADSIILSKQNDDQIEVPIIRLSVKNSEYVARLRLAEHERIDAFLKEVADLDLSEKEATMAQKRLAAAQKRTEKEAEKEIRQARATALSVQKRRSIGARLNARRAASAAAIQRGFQAGVSRGRGGS